MSVTHPVCCVCNLFQSPHNNVSSRLFSFYRHLYTQLIHWLIMLEKFHQNRLRQKKMRTKKICRFFCNQELRSTCYTINMLLNYIQINCYFLSKNIQGIKQSLPDQFEQIFIGGPVEKNSYRKVAYLTFDPIYLQIFLESQSALDLTVRIKSKFQSGTNFQTNCRCGIFLRVKCNYAIKSFLEKKLKHITQL